MANNPELITTFNTLVDQVIAGNRRGANTAFPRGAMWPGMDNFAKAADLGFHKVERGDARNSIIGRNVGDFVMRAVSVEKRVNLSFDGRDERYRKAAWVLRTHGDGTADQYVHLAGSSLLFGHSYTHEISDEQFSAGLEFIRSPHLLPEFPITAILAALTEEDVQDYFKRLDRDRESDERLREGLKEIDRSMLIDPSDLHRPLG